MMNNKRFYCAVCSIGFNYASDFGRHLTTQSHQNRLQNENTMLIEYPTYVASIADEAEYNNPGKSFSENWINN